MSEFLEKTMLQYFPTYGQAGNLTHARGLPYTQVRES
jgi:hypothetical protein